MTQSVYLSRNSDGVNPVEFLKKRLNVAFELKPASMANPRSEMCLFLGLTTSLLNSSTRYSFTNSKKFLLS